MIRSGSLLMAFALAGCASAPTPPEDGLETVLFNPVITDSALEVSVMSFGCTEAEHFYLLVEEQLIELRRTAADRCRRAPELIRLSFAYDFSQQPYQFSNDLRFTSKVPHYR